MKFFDRSKDTSHLTINGINVVTIKRRKTGDFPFYLSNKIELFNYSGGFKTMENAKKHVRKNLKAFALGCSVASALDQNDDRLLELMEGTKVGIDDLQNSIENDSMTDQITYFDNVLKNCDEALKILNERLNK